MQELILLLSEDRIKTDQESLTHYGQDWTRYYSPKPKAIVFPKTTNEVVEIVKWARKKNMTLVPSGGRTGLSGGAVAKDGEIVVSFDRMNKVLEVNKIEQTITVEPGVITEDLQNRVKEEGFYFPVDFAARGSSQIGGNIATNAGGIKVIRYGLMRDWVAGLEVVTGAGEVLSLNNSLVKNASGYDLRHLFIGSEGTLGFVTKATLRFTNPPPPLQVMLIGVNELDAVMKIFEEFNKKASVVAFELFTDKALKCVMEANPQLQKPMETDSKLYVLVEFEAKDDSDLEKAMEAFETSLEQEWAVDGSLSQSESQSKDFWKFREDISEATSKHTPYKNDVSVSISKVPDFMKSVDSVLTKEYPNIEVVWFGHIGDGNLHINILKPKNENMDDFLKKCRVVDKLLYTEIKRFGGSVSAEHGVGLSKKPFLNFTRSDEEIALMKGIKKVFDPDSVMNPGKVFD